MYTSRQIKSSIDPQVKAFPNIQDTILQIIAEKDWVSICVKHVGTNSDSLRGIPPTHQEVNYHVGEMYRIKRHKIIEIYVVEDQLSMYQQMGVIPLHIRALHPCKSK